MRWHGSRAIALAGIALLGVASAPPQASAEGTSQFQVTVAYISDTPGSIDPKGKSLHQKLKGEFRYESLEVVAKQKLAVAQEQSGSVDLPNGRKLVLQTLVVDDQGVLVAVDVGKIQTDVRVKRGHLVILGAERHKDGKLVIGLELL